MSDEQPQDPSVKDTAAETPDDKGSQAKDAAPKKDKKGKKARDEKPANVADFEGKVEILCDQRLPQFDSGSAQAYAAYSNDHNKSSLIALVCDREHVPRRAAANIYNGFVNLAMAKLVVYGTVFWPPEDRELYVFIYYNNLGKALMEPNDTAALGWRQDDVLNVVVKPMVNVLQDFRDKDFVHGSIRPSNMFMSTDAGKAKSVILGDALACPPSYSQPAIYEPIQRAMADPISRGKGTNSDDLYALGVSIAVLMRQNDPLKGLSPEQVVQKKLELGSYAAITGKDRFKGEILELLRGLLHDDTSQRWTIDEVVAWLDGRRLSPKQATATKKAPRPISLAESRFYNAPMLAMHMHDHPKEAKRLIEDGTLENWIERSLEDEEMALRYEKALTDSRQQSTGAGYEACLLSNVCIALDPNAPLRYRGMNIICDSLGTLMSQLIYRRESITKIAEIFLTQVGLNWLAVQNTAVMDVTGLFSKFERCKRYLKSSKFGEGPERALYILSPESPCQSESLRDYFATDADQLLAAFEDMCRKGRPPKVFLDKHVVAFLQEKDSKSIENYLFDLNTHENHRQVAATLKCFANIQRRYKMPDMPFLARVMAPMLQVVAKRYHDRNVQEKIREAIAEFQVSGNLVKIAALFENAEVQKKDFLSFKKAMLEFQKIEQEREMLETRLQDKSKFGFETGRSFSAVFSCILAFVLILGAASMYLSEKSLF